VKISKEQIKTGIELAEKHNVKSIFVNDKGEFFRLESDAKNSVSSDHDRYVSIDASTESVGLPDTKAVIAESTNDIATVKEVNAYIDTCTDVDSILEVVEAEKKGFNRKTIIAHATKRMNELKTKE